jgi:membrane associated rhomboid family serine protease
MVTLYFYADSTRLLGASGMIYGMVALWLVLYIHRDTDHSLMMRLFRATGFALIMLFPETYNPSTSYLAHASGFVIGIITGLLVLPFTRVRTV